MRRESQTDGAEDGIREEPREGVSPLGGKYNCHCIFLGVEYGDIAHIDKYVKHENGGLNYPEMCCFLSGEMSYA